MKIPNLSDYKKYTTKTNATIDGVSFPGLQADFFQRELEDKTESVGVFRYSSEPFLMAWGDKSATHCSYHAVRFSTGEWSSVTAGCPIFRPLDKAGERVGLEIEIAGTTVVVRRDAAY